MFRLERYNDLRSKDDEVAILISVRLEPIQCLILSIALIVKKTKRFPTTPHNNINYLFVILLKHNCYKRMNIQKTCFPCGYKNFGQY